MTAPRAGCEPPRHQAPSCPSLTARLRLRAVWAAVDTGCRLGLARRLLAPRAVRRVLVYHGVDRAGRKDLNGRFVSAAQLDQTLTWLRHNTTIVGLDDFLTGAGEHDRPTVALTFDDGYAGMAHHVLPLLELHRVPATFFVTSIRARGQEMLWPDALDLATRWTSGPITLGGEPFGRTRKGLVSRQHGDRLAERARGKSPAELTELVEQLRAGPLATLDLDRLWEYWRPLDADELQQLASCAYVTLGAHGTTHADLATQTPEVVRDELATGRQWLETVTGRSVDLLAWPFGRATREGVQIARELGFRHQLFADPQPAVTDTDLHGRLTMNPFVSWRVAAWAVLQGAW